MERLTIRSDICCEPENNIVYSNPNDPEGMYNILDLAECLYNGGEAEAGILLDISNRLAAYEDTGLTPEEVHQLKAKYEALESDKNVIESSHINAEMNLEAQQQEIDRLKEKLNAVLQDFYQYVQGGKEICAFCLHDYECEPGETICGATYKGFKWRGEV